MTSSAADSCSLYPAPRIAALHTQAVQFHHAEHGIQRQTRVLASEVPIALVFNGISHAVMMGTPLDLEDFAIGFALSEGIIDSAADCYGVEVTPVAAAAASLPEGMDGLEVQLEIASRCFARLKDHRRSMSGRTGCGVCGVESFAALDLSFDALPTRDWVAQVDLPTVLQAIDNLPPKQLLNAQAGAIHAAGWATLDGQVHDVIEDVGRHNALDKLLGRLARTGRLQDPGFVVLSSRGSHELVRKCAKLGIGALATISAPTAMGVRMAELTGLRFWGLCRPPKATLYVAGAGLTLD
ncbi:formate dehydrogenase accessory sulfurtransferase FdhD [Comamonas sp.]|uniref:formate dehydrogenase accessory sulfurtransferase FdhD n=1 Tax=Comamonas sp. TaxID=34028 RepID=UPI0028A07D75|nr:formate dehydrogenase accessory sulfurtransferase FdhD [Comamonas sp.]